MSGFRMCILQYGYKRSGVKVIKFLVENRDLEMQADNLLEKWILIKLLNFLDSFPDNHWLSYDHLSVSVHDEIMPDDDQSTGNEYRVVYTINRKISSQK
jgi:hypothetical protein